MTYVSHKRILYTELQVCYPLIYFPFFKVAITEGSNGLGDFAHIQSNELGNPIPVNKSSLTTIDIFQLKILVKC
jgi:hypothetical protein